MTATTPIQIDVISDVVCPWCYVGRQRLAKALQTLPEIAAEVRWRPFQLDPTIPPEGKDRHAYMIAKFGSEQRIGEIQARIVEVGTAEGIDFDFDAIKIAPNTLNAHRLIRWAANAGGGTQDRLVGGLFARYFERGDDIGDPAVLIVAASDAGMDSSVVETLLPTDADRDAVAAEISTASRMGVAGVPCFLLGGKYALVGAQDAQAMARAISEVARQPAQVS